MALEAAADREAAAVQGAGADGAAVVAVEGGGLSGVVVGAKAPRGVLVPRGTRTCPHTTTSHPDTSPRPSTASPFPLAALKARTAAVTAGGPDVARHGVVAHGALRPFRTGVRHAQLKPRLHPGLRTEHRRRH